MDFGGEVVAAVFVAGRPRTKGHIQPVHVPGRGGRPCSFGGGKDRPLTQAWMGVLGNSLQRQLGIELRRVLRGKLRKVERVDAAPHAGAVRIDCFFRFDRSLSMAEAAEVGQVWGTHAVEWPTARSIGDEDTLRRAVLDSLTKSGVIADDALSIGGANFKRWTLAGEPEGVAIVVREAPPVSDLLDFEGLVTGGL